MEMTLKFFCLILTKNYAIRIEAFLVRIWVKTDWRLVDFPFADDWIGVTSMVISGSGVEHCIRCQGNIWLAAQPKLTGLLQWTQVKVIVNILFLYLSTAGCQDMGGWIKMDHIFFDLLKWKSDWQGHAKESHFKYCILRLFWWGHFRRRKVKLVDRSYFWTELVGLGWIIEGPWWCINRNLDHSGGCFALSLSGRGHYQIEWLVKLLQCHDTGDLV